MSKTLPDPAAVVESSALLSVKVDNVYYVMAFCGLHSNYIIWCYLFLCYFII